MCMQIKKVKHDPAKFFVGCFLQLFFLGAFAYFLCAYA